MLSLLKSRSLLFLLLESTHLVEPNYSITEDLEGEALRNRKYKEEKIRNSCLCPFITFIAM